MKNDMKNQQAEALMAVRRCAETIKPRRGCDEFADGVSVAVRMIITHIDWLLEQVQAGHQIPFQVQHNPEWPFEARVTSEPRLLPPQSEQASPDDVRRAVARLSQALGHPKEVEALEGQSVEAALIDMAACQLMLAKLLADAPEAPAQADDSHWNGRISTLMKWLGMPTNSSLYMAMWQLVIELRRPTAPEAPATAVVQSDPHGRKAFERYLQECDECLIQPDVAGAFNAGWQAAAAALAQLDALKGGK